VELFEHAARDDAPLAERMRPTRVAELVGQTHLLGPGRLLRRSIAEGKITSMILFGPPGSGKTTLARVFSRELDARFESFSAVLGGVPELRKLIQEAKERRALRGERTVLFVDEIHRFNKAQQDALLPHVEAGTVTLVGATTENPAFAVNAALLSRAPVYALHPLSGEDLLELLRRAVSEERGLARREWLEHETLLARIASHADGDARRALTLLESVALGGTFSEEAVADVLSGKRLRHDKSGDSHYDVASAFIKSLRGSDPDAAIYWMMRLVEGGDDPLFVLRRMLIFASEDVGLADPRALEQAVAADEAFRRLGMPEGLHVMSQCCLYLACAPKSNRSYMAFTAAREDVERHGSLPVPQHLRNAPTKLAKELGHGAGYRYPHDEGGFARDEAYLPERLVDAKYYDPTQNGVEARIRERLANLFPKKRG
jgi:putative ATPase